MKIPHSYKKRDFPVNLKKKDRTTSWESSIKISDVRYEKNFFMNF